VASSSISSYAHAEENIPHDAMDTQQDDDWTSSEQHVHFSDESFSEHNDETSNKLNWEENNNNNNNQGRPEASPHIDHTLAPSSWSNSISEVQAQLQQLHMGDGKSDYAFISDDVFATTTYNGGSEAAANMAHILQATSNMLSGAAHANDWAGARHWKYANRRRDAAMAAAKRKLTSSRNNNASSTAGGIIVADAAAGSTGDCDEEGDGDEPVKGNKMSRRDGTATKQVKISFKPEVSSDGSFFIDTTLLSLQPSGKADSTVFSTTTLAKSSSVEEINSLLLPTDAKLSVVDLCRLFTATSVVIPHQSLRSCIGASSMQALIATPKENMNSASLLHGGTDRPRDVLWGVWACSESKRGGMCAPARENRQFEGEEEEGFDSALDGCGTYNDDGGDDASDPFGTAHHSDINTESTATESSGAELGLLQAARKVEKIDIGYATVSKRINIQRLKTDIWKGLSTKMDLPLDEQLATENSEPNATTMKPIALGKSSANIPTQTVSFQELIADIAENPRQSDVTLPFYFICLLHLANENVRIISSINVLHLTILLIVRPIYFRN
jgi:hypothetical protein